MVLLQDPRALASGHCALPGDVAQAARLTTRLGELAILTMARLTVAIPGPYPTTAILAHASARYGCSLHHVRLQASGIMPLTGMELDAVAWASLGFSLFVLLYKFISLSPTVLPLTALFAAPVSAPHTPLPSPSHLPLTAGHQGPRRDRGVVQGRVHLVSHGHVVAAPTPISTLQPLTNYTPPLPPPLRTPHPSPHTLRSCRRCSTFRSPR